MAETIKTTAKRCETYRRALFLHQFSVDAHSVFVSYAYVHVVLFALFYAGSLSLGALVLSDAILGVAVLLSLVARFVAAVYAERMLEAWRNRGEG